MSDVPRTLLGALALLMLLTALAAAAWLVWGPPLQQVQVIVDGRELQLPPMHVGHWLVAALALVLVIVLLAVLVPLALLFGVGVPLLVAGVSLAVVLSPLWLIALLVWWLLRRDRRAAPPRAQ